MEPRLTSLASGGGCGCKLSPHVLKEILREMPVPHLSADVLVDATTSDDAAVYRINDDQAVVATTDFFAPIVDDPYDFGRIAATNALSDVFAMGATPFLSLAIVGMPVDVLSAGTISKIVKGGADVALEAGAPVLGGHSIDTAEPLYGLIALGLAHPEKIKTNAGARPGDQLILTKPLGVGILSAALKKGMLGSSGYQAMIQSTTRLNSVGALLGSMNEVHAITDVTGFGLLGHALEMARGSGVTLRIERSTVPVLPVAKPFLLQGLKTGASDRNWSAIQDTVKKADHLSSEDIALLTDPQTSGGLLLSIDKESVLDVMTLLNKHGFEGSAIVGDVVEGPVSVQAT